MTMLLVSFAVFLSDDAVTLQSRWALDTFVSIMPFTTSFPLHNTGYEVPDGVVKCVRVSGPSAASPQSSSITTSPMENESFPDSSESPGNSFWQAVRAAAAAIRTAMLFRIFFIRR